MLIWLWWWSTPFVEKTTAPRRRARLITMRESTNAIRAAIAEINIGARINSLSSASRTAPETSCFRKTLKLSYPNKLMLAKNRRNELAIDAIMMFETRGAIPEKPNMSDNRRATVLELSFAFELLTLFADRKNELATRYSGSHPPRYDARVTLEPRWRSSVSPI